jgi:uncharacterized protein YbbK (DUF523 family)
MTHPAKPLVAVSSCLLGEAVRWDGRDKREPVVIEEIGPHVTWVPICPEVELGLGVPREAIRLERHGRELRLVGVESRKDLTAEMDAWAAQRLDAFAEQGVRGFVLKSRSPSCGRADAEVTDSEGEVVGRDAGRFTRLVILRWPDIPVCTEEELRMEVARKNFLAAIQGA